MDERNGALSGQLPHRCLKFLAAAVQHGDDEVRRLVGGSFLDDAYPFAPDTSDFVAAWPPALRLEAKRRREMAA